MRWLLSSACAGAAVLIGGAGARAEEKPQSISFISGTCEALRLPRDELTPRCLPQLINIVYPDERMEFAAQAGDDRMVLLRIAPARDGRDPAARTLLSIAAVNPQSGEVEDHDVTGSCRDAQSPAAPRRIDCSATDKDGGRYELHFVSDGRAPTTTNF